MLQAPAHLRYATNAGAHSPAGIGVPINQGARSAALSSPALFSCPDSVRVQARPIRFCGGRAGVARPAGPLVPVTPTRTPATIERPRSVAVYLTHAELTP
jgi:hypothetical protein